MHVDQPVRQNPFPGLRPFTTEEDYLFFGREEQTTELLGLLREHRFLAVVGTSGSGKSSLVRAGLLPALHGGNMAQAGSSWEVLVLRPGGDPMSNLARALVDADLYDPDDVESLPRITATLNRSRLGLVEAVRQSELPEGTNLLVVVDQFEELFRFRQAGVSHQEAAAAFVKLLLAAARESDQRIYIAITMRSDYLGECSHIAGLAEAVNDGEYLIPRLSRDQRRAAIEKPVSVGGGTIAHRLVQKLLNDVGDDADHLPVLQHALMRIFDYWTDDHADGEPLDLRHYERAGGLQEALSRHSDEVFDELPSDRLRTVAEKLFKALTERGPDNRGIRRPTRLDRLCAIIDAQQEELIAVVDAFRRSGRTFLMPMAEVELEPHTVIDISHESLMRVWKRLDRWVEEESQSARIYRRLADTAALHVEGKAGIYHDPDLQIALTWRATEHPTEAWAARYHAGFEQALAFLEKSRDVQHAEEQRLEAARLRELEQAKKLAAAERLRAQEQKRSAYRLKWLSSGVAVVAGLALIAFGMAMVAWHEAQQKELEAQHNAALAQQKEQEAQKSAELAEASATDARKSADAAQVSAKEALHQQQIADANFRKALKTVDEYFINVSESRLLKVPGLQPLRKELLQSALAYYEGFVQQHGADPSLQNDLAEAYTRVARITSEIGDKGKALETMAKALTMRENLLARDPSDLKRKLDLVAHYQLVGNVHRELGDSDHALKALEEAHKRLLVISPQKAKTVSISLLTGTFGGIKAYESHDPKILSAFASLLTDRAAAHVAANDLQPALSDNYAAIHIRRNLVSEANTGGKPLLQEKGKLTAQSKIDPRGTHVQMHSFAMQAGQGYNIDLESADFDAFLMVRDPQGRLVAQDDDGGEGTNARIFFRPSASGVHTLIATSFEKGQMGAYTLTVRGEGQGKLAFDQSDRLTDKDARDEFGRSYRSQDVQLEAGRKYIISAVSPADEIDPILLVWDGKKMMGQGNTSGKGTGAHVTFTAPRADNFRLNVASRIKGQMGAYRLTVNEVAQGNLLLDKTDELASADPKDKRGTHFKVHELKLQAGDRCVVDLIALDPKFDPYLRIEDAEGKQLAEDDDSGGNLNARIILRPTSAGVYRLIATSFKPGDTGRYRLTVRRDRVDARLAPLEYRLAQQWLKLGELIRALDMYEAALPYQQEAQNILLGLVAGHPEHELASEFERDLAATYENMGELLFKSSDNPKTAEASRQKAVQALRRAVGIRQKLVQLNPAVTELQAELARSYFALANVFAALEQTGDAVLAYRQATTHQFVVYATGPSVRAYAHTLARYHAALGRLQQQSGKSAEALASYRQARQFLEKPAPTQPAGWFELALVRAACSTLDPGQQQQDADLAMQALQNGAAAGFDDLEQLKKAVELEPLRARADLEKLAAELQAKSKKLVWLEDFDEAKALAAKEGKDLFVYFGAADWATFDVAFRNRVFTQPPFVDFVAKRFVLMKLEFNRFRPPPKGTTRWLPELAAKWQQNSVPYLILADEHGRAYAKHSGASGVDAKGFVDLLERYRNVRVRRDQALEEAEKAVGAQKAKLLDAALQRIPPEFTGDYADLFAKVGAQILRADPANSAGLRTKYLGKVITGARAEIAALVKEQKWPGALEKLNTALDGIRPSGAEGQGLYLDRARVHISLGNFPNAAADFERAHTLNAADPQIWLEHVYSLVHSGDPEGYRRVCAALLERFAKSDKEDDAYLVAWAGSLAPDAVADWSRVVAVGEKAVAPTIVRGDRHHALALAQYRAGNYPQALERLRKWDSPLSDVLFALTYKRLGQDKEAAAALAKAQEGLKELSDGKVLSALTPAPRGDWLVFDILLGEAAAQFENTPLATDARFQMLRVRDYLRQKQWDKAATIFGQLIAQQPDNVQLLLERARIHDGLKQPDKAAADFARALEIRTSALAAKRQLLQKDPAATEQRDATAQALRDLADTQRRVGRPADAAATLMQLTELWAGDGARIYAASQQIAALFPMAGKEQSKQVGELALKALRQAIDAGQGDPAIIGRDPNFQPLRSGAEFAKLLADVEMRARFTIPGELLREFKEHTAAVEAVVVTPDGRRAISGGYDGHLRFWDVETGEQLRAINIGQGMPISGIAIATDGRKVLAGCHDKVVRLYDVDSGAEIRQFQGHTDKVWTVALSSDGRWALSASEDKTVRLWEVDTGKEAGQFVHDAALWSVAFSPDGRLAVSGDKAQTIRIWEVKSGKELRRWDTLQEGKGANWFETTIWCVSFTPDGNHVVAGSRDTIRLWEVNTGRLIRTFVGHQGVVRCIDMTAQPEQMVSGDTAGNLIVWDLQTSQELWRTKAPGSRVGLTILPEGGRALTADTDKLVRLWLVSPEAARARGHAKEGRLAQAESEYALAVKQHPNLADLRFERSRFSARAGKWQQAADDLAIVLKTRPADWQLWADRGRCLTMLGQTAPAAADIAKALQLGEQLLTKNPDDSALADALTGLLLDKLEPKWTDLKPLAVKSEGGATLTVQPDDSVLAGGATPDKDVYVIETEIQGRIGAIRLEAIPDSSLPGGGSGRSGNFILTDIRVTAGDSVVKWSRAFADFSQEAPNSTTNHHPVANAIDADESTGWAIFPRLTEPHWAVFMPTRPVGSGDKTRLSVRLAFQNKDWVKHTLGRFRLSVAGASNMVQQTDWFRAAATPHGKVAAAYLALGDAKHAAEFLTKATAANPNPVPAEWLLLALAHAKLMDADQAGKARLKAVELLKTTGADTELRALLREVILALGTNHPDATALIAAVSGELPAELNEAIQQNPDKADGYQARGNWYAERARWKEAGADLAQAFRLEPSTYTGMRLGFLLIQTGDVDRYRAHCQAMLERWAATDKNGEADQTLKTILFLPDLKADAKHLAGMAEVAVSGDKNVDWFEWYMVAKGLHDYRTGKYADALATCRESRRRAPQTKGDPQALASLNFAIEAMALVRSGDAAGAQRALTEAKSNLEFHVPGIDAAWWHDWLAANILYREAEELIVGKTKEQAK